MSEARRQNTEDGQSNSEIGPAVVREDGTMVRQERGRREKNRRWEKERIDCGYQISDCESEQQRAEAKAMKIVYPISAHF